MSFSKSFTMLPERTFNPRLPAMIKYAYLLVFLSFGYSTAYPWNPVIKKLDANRYQYERDSDGNPHLVDLWMKFSDVYESERYKPSANVYHLFTRRNPTISQPLLINSPGLLQMTEYNSNRRTIILIHGWRNSATSDFNAVLVPAFLAAEDVNVIVVDWSAGAETINYTVAVENTLTSGRGVAEFINWLNRASGSTAAQYHIVGHGLGGHQAGIVARNVQGAVSYVTGLDPSLAGWILNNERFKPNDGDYTEVIHTNIGIYGFIADLAQVDFYPNGGAEMPGCGSSACNHARSFFYFAESVRTGGFTGRQCLHYTAAVQDMCNLPGRLQMGGLRPKTGRTGVYYVRTRRSSPFSRD